jgi:aspartate/methionine/tyrosine aminotransferase
LHLYTFPSRKTSSNSLSVIMRSLGLFLSLTTVNAFSIQSFLDSSTRLFSTSPVSESHVSTRAAGVESFKVMDVLRRANELQAAGHDVLHCEVGQPETGAPSTVAQAAVSALTEPQVMGYTDAFGMLALREKIAKHYQSYYKNLDDTQVPSADRIVITTGSSGAFLLAFTACFDTGDVVALASSGYPCYRNILSALGCEQANLGVNAEFKLTATELRAEIEKRQAAGDRPMRGLIMSSPSNPTGAMLTPDELKELCALCDEHNIQFLSDEIYHGITYGKEEATALQYSQKALVINSFSKFYSSESSV